MYLNHDEDAELARQEILSLVNIVEGFFSSQLGINFHIVVRGTEAGDPIIWETQDPFCCDGIVTLYSEMNADWNMHRPCIPKDAIFLLAAKDYAGGGGQATGSVCGPNSQPNEVNVGLIDKFTVADARAAFKFAHELGHLLGSGELESTPCSSLCDDQNLSPLMCSDGVGQADINIASLSSCSFETFEQTINNHCNDCLGTPQPLPTCPVCYETGMITVDNIRPIPGCSGRDIINYTVTICNSCDPQDLEVRVNFNGNRFTYLPPSDFPVLEDVNNPPLNSYELVSTLPYAVQECKEFHFTLQVKETPTGPGNGTASSININGDGLATQPLSKVTILVPEFTYINGSTSPVNISTVNLQSKEIELDGVLNIDEDFSLDGFLFKMNPGAKIVVEPGNKLEITNGTHLFGCSELWESIEVQEGATLIIDNATIEDGYTAVHAIGGGNLSITNSTFNRNFVGVQVDGPVTVGGLTNFNAFYGNSFDGGTSILPAPANMPLNLSLPAGNETAFAGVWIQTSANPVHSLNNVFKNLSNGIYANATSLKVTKNQFTNIWENGYFDWMAGYGIRVKDHSSSHNFQQKGFGKDAEPLSFSLCSKAMRLEGIRVDYIKDNNIRANTGIELIANYPKAVVLNNRIESWARGVELNQMSPNTNVWVSLNDIEVAGGIGIQSNMMNLGPVSEKGLNISLNNVILKAPKTRGIELNVNNTAHIMENKVSANLGLSGFTGIRVNNDNSSALTCNEVTTPLPNYDKTFGIEIWDGQLTRQMCNGVSNTAKGVYFTMGSFAPERFQENTFEGNDFGLQLSTSAAIGQQTHRGNIWKGSFGSYGAQHLSPFLSDWTQSQFTVHTGTSGTYRPFLPPGQELWFFTEVSGSPSEECQLISTCITGLPPFPVDGLYGLDTTIATGNFITTDFEGVTNWLARRYLYGKLAENPALIAPGSLFESFYNATANSTVGSFAAIEAGMEALYEIPAQTATQVSVNFDTLSVRMEEIGGIDSLLQVGGYDTALVQQRSVAMQVLQNTETTLDTLMQPVMSQRILDAATLATQNATIATDSVYELNERIVKDIYLNTIAQGIAEFDGTQLAGLESIANQCPLTGGSAVFKARSLLAMVRDSVYDDEMLCEQIGERSESQMTIEHSGFALFPNPAQNKVTVVKPPTIEEDTEIFIFNSLGKSVLRKVLPGEIPSVTLNTSGLEEGTFIVAIYSNGRKIFTDKLVIIR